MSGLSHDKHPVRTAFTVSLSNYPPCPMAAPVIYTTNAIESVNMALRKVTRNHRIFPSDEAVYKVVYLAMRNMAKKWTMPIRDWKPALNRFAMEFGERFPK